MDTLTHQEAKPMEETVMEESLTEGVGGVAAVVLSILAIVGVLPMVLAPIAAIVIGAALLISSGTIAAHYDRLLTDVDPSRTAEWVGNRMAGGAIFGIAVIVLGILALIGISSPTLLTISIIVFGGALMLASGATTRLHSLVIRNKIGTGTSPREEIARGAIYTAGRFEVLIGAGVVVLGILALNHTANPDLLTYIGLLSCGAAVMGTGTAFSARMFGIFSH